jgi:hypothetical protein
MSEPRSSDRGPIQFYDVTYGFMFIWGLYSVIRHWKDANHLTYSFLGGVAWLTLGAFALFVKHWIPAPIKKAQKAAAKRILDFHKAIYASGPYEYRFVQASDFPELDHEFYDSTRSRLEAQGFRFLGDRENVTLTRLAPDSRTFVRTMVSTDGTICGSAWHRKLNQRARNFPAEVRTIEFETEFSDGTFVTTNNSLARTLPVPGIEAERLAAETPADELLRIHRERLARVVASRPYLAATKLQTMEDVIAFQRRMHAVKARHKQSIGYTNVQSVERALGRSLLPPERTFATEIEKLSEDERLANESGPSFSR